MINVISETREDELSELIEKAKDWALLNGLTIRSFGTVDFVPFTLVPSTFPRADYEELARVQPAVNELMLRVAQDRDFIRRSLERCARVDEFTARLLKVLDESSAQKTTLGLLRADYMQSGRWNGAIDAARCKQVEVNTIASGHGWLGAACSRLHRYVLEEMDLMKHASDWPDNDSLDGLCSGMYEAWKIYDNPSAVILFLVESNDYNIADQRFHEYALRQMDPRIHVVRRTLTQISKQAVLVDSERRLLVDGREVALVYMRTGYSPKHYPTDSEWQARCLIERSYAIKCPTVGYHLAGCKKIQQLLARPGALEKFLSPHDSVRLRRFFAGLYTLDATPEGEDALESALKRPEDFVLKPQREGGSNNFFGMDLKKKLSQMRNSEERNSWILMDRIVPATQRNYLVRRDSVQPMLVSSELGIFGVVLAVGDRILTNEAVGHNLRTKPAECDEGGVSSGYGALDSPFLL